MKLFCCNVTHLGSDQYINSDTVVTDKVTKCWRNNYVGVN